MDIKLILDCLALLLEEAAHSRRALGNEERADVLSEQRDAVVQRVSTWGS